MPSRLFVPVPGIAPERVKLPHIHGAISRWFDRNDYDHTALEKPYAISPLAKDKAGQTGVEVATLTEQAAAQLAAATAPQRKIRLGNQVCGVGQPYLMHTASWGELAAVPLARHWCLELVTPATFRRGDRTSPLPQPATILRSLERTWTAFSDTELPGPGVEAACGAIWVSALDLRSDVLRVSVRSRHEAGPVDVTVSGSVGYLELRCDDPEVALSAGPLLSLAAYAGVGSMTRKGLGVTRVHVRTLAPSSAADGKVRRGASV